LGSAARKGGFKDRERKSLQPWRKTQRHGEGVKEISKAKKRKNGRYRGGRNVPRASRSPKAHLL